MNFRSITGIVLGILMLVSSILSIAGIWGKVDSETLFSLLMTFVVIGGTTIGLSYIADTFFTDKK